MLSSLFLWIFQNFTGVWFKWISKKFFWIITSLPQPNRYTQPVSGKAVLLPTISHIPHVREDPVSPSVYLSQLNLSLFFVYVWWIYILSLWFFLEIQTIIPSNLPDIYIRTHISKVALTKWKIHFSTLSTLRPHPSSYRHHLLYYPHQKLGGKNIAEKNGEARAWLCPRSQVNPWDGLPSEGPWLCEGKNSRAYHSKVKAGLLREIPTP